MWWIKLKLRKCFKRWALYSYCMTRIHSIAPKINRQYSKKKHIKCLMKKESMRNTDAVKNRSLVFFSFFLFWKYHRQLENQREEIMNIKCSLHCCWLQYTLRKCKEKRITFPDVLNYKIAFLNRFSCLCSPTAVFSLRWNQTLFRTAIQGTKFASVHKM